MSHWMKGKIALGCSIDILQKALIRINSTWKDRIETDAKGQLKINGRDDSYNVVLRSGSNTTEYGRGHSDVGFKKLNNKTWEITSYDFSEVPNIRGKVTQEVTVMRYEELVKLQTGGEIIEMGKKGNKKRLVLRTPVPKEYLYA